jgi:hypothetical protein
MQRLHASVSTMLIVLQNKFVRTYKLNKVFPVRLSRLNSDQDFRNIMGSVTRFYIFDLAWNHNLNPPYSVH